MVEMDTRMRSASCEFRKLVELQACGGRGPEVSKTRHFSRWVGGDEDPEKRHCVYTTSKACTPLLLGSQLVLILLLCLVHDTSHSGETPCTTSCCHLRRARIHSWQNAAVLARVRMSRRSKRVAASWLILLSLLCAVSEFGSLSSMRLRNCLQIATEAGRYAFATSWISGCAVIDPVRVAASRACILPYSTASSGKYPARRSWMWRAPTWHLPVQADTAREERGIGDATPAIRCCRCLEIPRRCATPVCGAS